jgi:hypothetical protein
LEKWVWLAIASDKHFSSLQELERKHPTLPFIRYIPFLSALRQNNFSW